MEKKRKILLNCYFITLVILVLFSILGVLGINSISYNISSPTVSDGGAGASSSSNFNLSFISESITGSLSSSSFKNWLGFFTGTLGGDRLFPLIFFVNPTPLNETSTTNTSVVVNVSISEVNLNEVKWNWNGTNFTIYNDSLVLMMNFENLSGIGESYNNSNGTVIVDVSKYSNNGTLYVGAGNSGNWTSGKYGGAYQFDGKDDWVDVGDIDLKSQMTLSTWIKWGAGTSTRPHFLCKGVGGSTGSYCFMIETTNKLEIFLDSGSGWVTAATGTFTVPTNTWVHAVVTYNGTTTKIYFNGIGDGSGTGISGNLRDISNSTQIGRFYPGTSSTYFNGSIDEVRIWNRSLTAAEVYEVYSSNLQKYNQTQWYLYVNQSKNATNPLDRANYTYFASAKDIALNENRTEVRKIIILNTGPNIPSVVYINSSHGTNKTIEDLNCFANISDPEGDEMNVSVRWYKNGVLNLSQEYFNGVSGYANGSLFIGMLNNTNTTKGENWSCSLRLYDSQSYSDWSGVSSNLTILNSLPSAILLMPNNGNITTNRTPIFIWNGSDDDSDSLEYEINISAYYTGGGKRSVCNDYKNKAYIGTSLNYTPSTYIQCLIDNGYYLNWSARAYDGEAYGNWAIDWNLSVSSVITISLPVNITNFGILELSVSDNTSDNNPLPFVLRNDGNSDVNITVNFTNIWTTVTIPNETFQFKIRNLTSRCFIEDGTTTSWTSSPIITTHAINRLNFTSGYQDGCNNVSIDIYLKVPVDEPSGNKNSTVTFTSSLAEPGYGAD